MEGFRTALAIASGLLFPVLSPGQAAAPAGSDRPAQDWPELARYRAANQALGLPASHEQRVIFFGDSITQRWDLDAFFPGKHYLNRGISGQTTSQMLVRFRPDVVNLKPSVVVILAGINDIAENTGSISIADIAGNLASMTEIARANHIDVVLCSVLPANAFPWRTTIHPVHGVAALNTWLQAYAAESQLGYVDYFTALVDEYHGLKAEYGVDAVHPNRAGYAVMTHLAEKAIEAAALEPPASR
jgi:lysophospholipase L1-like esterase